MIWGAVLECIARALRILGFTRKPVKVLFLGLENAGKTTLMFAMKHGPRAAYDIAHDPTFGLSMLPQLAPFFSFFFCAFLLCARSAIQKKTKKQKKKKTKKEKKKKKEKKDKKQISRRWTWRGTKCARTISVGDSVTFGPTTSFRRGASFSSSTRRTPIGSPSPKQNSTCGSASFFFFSFLFFSFFSFFLFFSFFSFSTTSDPATFGSSAL